MTSQETKTHSARSLRLQRLVCVALLVFIPGQMLIGRDCRAEGEADPYNVLYDVLMTRHAKDGKSYAENETSPAVFAWSEFPFDDKTFNKFVAALDAFGALPQEKIEAYSDVQRALLQRHLWKVFDSTFDCQNWRKDWGWAGRKRFPKTHLDRRAAVRPKLASLMKRLALTKAEILTLPNTMAATVKSGGFAQSHDPKTPLKPFLPADLYSKDSSWFCLGEVRNPIPASVHTGDRQYRSAFYSFMRLPGGRPEALKYVETLQERTEAFPVGTQFALIDQAFLISKDGELVLSPLIVSVQLRAYLDVERSVREARPAPTQCLTEFNMQPRQLMKGNAVMRALTATDRRFEAGTEECQLGGGPHDPFEEGRMPTTRLNLCMRCHSGAPAKSHHSILTVSLRSRKFLKEDNPESISKATSKAKRDHSTWKAFQELWQVDSKKNAAVEKQL